MLPDSARPERTVELRRFHDGTTDLERQVLGRGDLVVGERRVQQVPLLVVDVALAHGGTEALDHPADALAPDQRRVDDLPDVVHR